MSNEITTNWDKVGDDAWRNRVEFWYQDGVHLTCVPAGVERSMDEAMRLEALRPKTLDTANAN